MKILISAAETSSDAHGAELLRALRAQGGADGPGGSEAVDAFGVGGPKLQAAGLRAVVDARELLAMGFSEVLGRLPRIFRALRQVSDASEAERPDVAVVIDYPDFHFRLAGRLKRQGVPVVYYIPPKVWVWRKKRMAVLKERFAKVLSILPFEVPFYEREGVPVRYVGNPLADQLPLSLTRDEARSRLGLGALDKVLVAMPGSRPAEIRKHVDLMLDGAQVAAARMRSDGTLDPRERLVVLMPFPVTSDLEAVRARVASWVKQAGNGVEDFILDVRVSQGDSFECMAAGDAGLIKSGTSTLEAALMRLPHAVVYKPSWLTEWIFKNVVRYRGPVGLSNLVAGWKEGEPPVYGEILCSEATVAALSDETVALFKDLPKRLRLARGAEAIRARILVQGGESPSAAAAREIREVVRARGPVARP